MNLHQKAKIKVEARLEEGLWEWEACRLWSMDEKMVIIYVCTGLWSIYLRVGILLSQQLLQLE